MRGSFERVQYAEGAYETLLSKILGVEQALRDQGIRVSGGSRLSEYRALLGPIRTVSDGPTQPPSDLITLHQAVHECNQLLLITEELSREPEIPGWRDKMQRTLLGQTLPGGEGARTPGRDTQFELYTLALLRRAGYQVELAEPDVVFQLTGLLGRTAIACKRLKSPRKLPKNVRSAANQIVMSELDGIIALDLSLLFDPGGEPLGVSDFAEGKKITQAIIDTFLQDHALEIRCLVDHGRVFGLMICLAKLFVFEPKAKLAVVTHWKAINLCDHRDIRDNHLADLVDRIGTSEVLESSVD